MKLKIFMIIVMLAVAGVIVYFTCFRENERTKVIKVLTELCQVSSKKSGTNPIALALALQKSDKIFAPEIELDFHHHLFNRKFTCSELTARIAQIQAMFQWLQIKAEKIQVSIHQDRALITFTGILDGVTKNSKQKVSEVRDIDCELQKISNKWLITAMKIQEVLEK